MLCNGIPAEEKSFRSFYETELSITPLRRALTAPSTESPVVSVSLHYNSGRQDVLLFLPGPHGAVFLSYNGKTDFLVRDIVPAHIIESCRRILSQETPAIR